MALKALVANGDIAHLELLAAVLIHEGFEVVSVADGRQALSHLEVAQPDLVMAADNLGGAGTRDLGRKLRATSPATRFILLLPTSVMADAAAQKRATGADAVLSTTVQLGELRQLLAGWGFATRQPKHQPSQAFAVAAPALQPIPIPVTAAATAAEVPALDWDDTAAGPGPLAPAVTAPAATAATAPLPVSGDLETTPLPRLIYELYVGIFSGVVVIERAGHRRLIHFAGGLPVAVDTFQVSETLGRLLLDHGRITMDDYTRSLELMRAHGFKQGEALISMGVLTDREVLDALAEQIRHKLNGIFAWREGTYSLEARPKTRVQPIVAEVHPLQAIWRGVHEHYDLNSLQSYFATIADRYAVRTELYALHQGTLGPLLRDAGVSALLDGATRFETAARAGARALPLLQALYVLLVTDMIHAAAAPGDSLTAPPAAISQIPPVPPATAVADQRRLAEDVAREYLRLQDADPFDALRLDASASPAEVDLAFTNIVASLGLSPMPADLPAELKRRATEVLALLQRAREVLRDPTLRDHYLEGERDRAAAEPSTAADSAAAAGVAALQTEIELDVGAGLTGARVYQQGMEHMRAGQHQEAVRRFTEAVEACPREADFQVALGAARLALEGFDTEAARTRVVACIDQALRLDPSHVGANLEMAKLLRRIGANDRAFAYVQRVLQRAPENQEARRLLASLG